ncbi:MlaD family protein [Geomonas sp.]|uniref:MlaD family protein n=1 Tax=Geomonas sp. TaxID=2651584 RepID=UPI002B4A8206|nr:MlaD family protein [Geomonas sp.]HJV33975.1 MlaD family protein [Geomonas sp.]
MKRSDNIARSHVKTGIFVVLALALFAWGVLLMGAKTKMFIPKGRISLIMNTVGGLKVGAPVWLAGVDVGVVRSIGFERPEENNQVEVVLEVAKDSLQKIGKDSVIVIKTRGLMGEKYVDITPSAHLVKVPETRVYGTTVPTLDDVTKKAAAAFDHLNEAMDKITGGQGSLGKMMADPKLYDNLSHLTTELNTFVTTANSGQGTLGKLNRSPELYEKLLSTLDRADDTLRDVQHSDGTLSKLIYDPSLYEKLLSLAEKSNQAADDMRELNKKISSPQGSLGKLMQDREMYDKGLALIERADRSVTSLEEVMARVRQGEGTAGKLLNDRALYDKMNQAVDDLDLLLNDVKEHPRRYFRFSVF